MGNNKSWLQRLADSADLQEENVTAQPLVEICGSSRVVIEHHLGVTEYGTQRICVRVKGGEYAINGTKLSLCRMCNQQLLIRGNIDSVEIRKGRG